MTVRHALYLRHQGTKIFNLACLASQASASLRLLQPQRPHFLKEITLSFPQHP